jgi:protoporphyrinogen oxidase
MEHTQDTDVLIIGGGLAGLCTAHTLSENNVEHLVIEKEHTPGGLARTLKFDGYGFDIGGHRFHTDKPEIKNAFIDLLEGRYTMVSRKSRILLNQKYFDYPLTFSNAIFSLGGMRSVKIIKELLLLPFRRTNGNDTTFEQWIVNRFGKTLYSIYFKPYTEKVWGIDCQELSSDWAQQRIGLLSIAAILKRMVAKRKKVPKTYVSQFLYPRNGIREIADQLAHKINTGQQRLLLNTTLKQINNPTDVVKEVIVTDHTHHRNMRIRAKKVISTIPLHGLMKSLSPLPPDAIMTAADHLHYRGVIVICIIINKDRVSDDTWIYFPEKAHTIGRIHEPGNWSAKLAPDGNTSLCCEIFSQQGDGLWEKDASDLIKEAVDNLESVGLLTTKTSSAATRKKYPMPTRYTASVTSIT